MSCPHQPGTVVLVDPVEELWSTCTAGCGRPLRRLYYVEPEGPRRTGWGWWKPATPPLL